MQTHALGLYESKHNPTTPTSYGIQKIGSVRKKENTVQIKTFVLTPFMQNCLVIEDQGEALVIDPGESHPDLLDTLSQYRIKMIINTHGHLDHCGGNAEVLEATGAPLALHAADLPLLHSMEQQAVMFGLSCSASPEPSIDLKENDTVTVGNTEFKILHTPGHTPGHISLVSEGIAIVGDCLFSGSIGRTDLPGGSYAQLIDSIKTKLLTLPDDTVVYSGHGPETTIGEERRSNPFLV